MNKYEAITTCVAVIAIAICVFVLAGACSVRAIEGDKLNSRARTSVECHISGSEWLDDSYSMTITCRLPDGSEQGRE